MIGLYEKYKIEKVDGTPVDPDAQYFVLRLDTDKHAREAIKAYAESLMEDYRKGLDSNPKLSMEIWDWLSEIALAQIRNKKA